MTQLYRRMVWIVILLAAAVLFAPPRPAHAATFTVNSTADAVDANPGNGVCATAGGVCTLRAAIQEANALAGADTIVFAVDGTFTLTLTGSGEDAAATGDLDITGDLTIIGNGQALTIIDGNLSDRVFEARPIADTTLTVNMSNLTIQRGSVTGTLAADAGGGILVDVVNDSGRTNLTLTNVTITGNTTGNNGGGISINRLLNDSANPTLTLIDSTIANNNAQNGGGIHCAACTLNATGSTISSNNATTTGGGINVTGNTAAISMTNGTLSGNTANNHGGGIAKAFGTGTIAVNFTTITNNTADANSSGTGDGGGIFTNSNTTIQNSIVQGNTDNSTATLADCNSSVNITSNGYNVVGAGTGCPSGGTGDSTAAALLGALADNGGDTLTHLPGGGSAAINRIPNGQSGCNGGVSVDQRGAVRADGANRGGAACDSGAVEADSSQTPTAVTLQSFAIHPASPTLLAALLLAAATLLATFWHRQKTNNP
ncbi:MAG: CSLREA domain-containing protein [Anaerolinea sp.]|nr:CSLREA domain-containing protein [Anaerolinea sp.]